MISRIHLSALLLIAALVWGALLVVDGVSVSLTWFRPLTAVTGVLVLFLAIFDRWAWRLPVLYPWFVSTPDIQGTWKGEIISTWTDPNTGSRIPPLRAFMVIRQTFSSIRMQLISTDSSSELLGGALHRDIDGNHKIMGTYRNTPRLLRRDVSPIHYGSIMMDVIGSPPYKLAGDYWTDRDTKGELYFSERRSELFRDFKSADEAYSKK